MTSNTETTQTTLPSKKEEKAVTPKKGTDEVAKTVTAKAPAPKKEAKPETKKVEKKVEKAEKAAPKGEKITILAKECPSKKGTTRAKRWGKLENGMTTTEAREEGIPSSYLKRMAAAGHLKIG